MPLSIQNPELEDTPYAERDHDASSSWTDGRTEDLA